MKLNIINARSERTERLIRELQYCGVSDYELWEGVFKPSIKESINLAHKEIVEYAKLADFPFVVIAEDDIKFSHPQSWKYFLDKMPLEFDMYLGGVFLGQPDENGIVKYFTGMTCYAIARRFYDIFLSTQTDEHIDRALAGKGEYIVCSPFICTQYDGFSSNTGKMEAYEYIQRDRIFFTGY